MKIFYKRILIIFLFALSLQSRSVSAEVLPINAYLFYGDSCPHCAQERRYLNDVLKSEYPGLEIYEYEIYNNRDNISLLREAADKLGAKVDGVPFLIIGDQPFIGYVEGLTSEEIKETVKKCSLVLCPDSLVDILSANRENISSERGGEGIDVAQVESTATQECAPDENQKIITLPLIGEVNALNFSLPVLTIVMGILDGFNPCAMWTLLFLISLLLGMKDRKRMWILGATFIVASASVYFMFMAAWLNLILFLGFVVWVRILIGVLALLGGGYSLKEFIFNKESGCKVTNSEKKRKVFEKLKLAVQQNSLPLALGGIIVLAFAVNLVELICSAGLPAVYTQVLALNEMTGWNYYLYILLYIFFFMLDDLLIFFIAMVTLQMTGVTTKYARTSRLIGGVTMLAIGLMLIFKPEWLMFG
ncbi:MAG: hypothetical protein WC180_06695 [Candidatus Paceibacterota bacterium]